MEALVAPPAIQAETLVYPIPQMKTGSRKLVTLSSKELVVAISRTDRPITQFDHAGEFIAMLTPNDALEIVRFKLHTGIIRGANGRVRSIRQVEPPRVIADAYPDMPVLWTIGYERRSAGRQVAA